MRHIVALCALALSACGGMAEADFANQYTADWCAHRLACDDQGELTFEGITSAEDCEARMINEVADWGNGCSYKATQAETCLAELEALTCPSDGTLGDPPPSCSGVYVECDPSAADDGGGDDTDAAASN